MPRATAKRPVAAADDGLAEPSLIGLRRAIAGSGLETQTVQLDLPPAPANAEEGLFVGLRGAGAPTDGGCELSQALLMRASGYYAHAASFGPPPASITLDFGDSCVRLLCAALQAGAATLVPATLAELLQAAAYLQVAAVLQACSSYLRHAVLEAHPAAVLRVALDLGLADLAAHIEADFLRDFYMLSGEKAAVQLKEWPPAKRRDLLGGAALAAPTECCVVETLCHLHAASSADAVALVDCVRAELMSAHELAAATLYLQHNAKWVDRRLSTALAWRLLSARVAADLAAWPALGGGRMLGAEVARGGAGGGSGNGGAAQPLDARGAGAEAAPARRMRRRCLHCGLSTTHVEGWSGTAMLLTARRIPCSWGPSRPIALQLEREDPRHAGAEAAGGTTGRAGGDTDSGGTGWDVQLSLYPDTFPPGFEAVCWAFGGEGFYWCKLGPLAKAGPTWWKVGFLASQLPHALPVPAAPSSSGIGGGASGDALLLVGWWVPEQ